MNNTISEKQLIANRENALKGWVKTPEGKEKVSYNAITHWITSERVLGDERKLFEKIRDELHKDLHPQGYLERILVERIAFHQMKLMRVASMESVYIDLEPYRTLLRDLQAQKDSLPKPNPQLSLLSPYILEGTILSEDEIPEASLESYRKTKQEYEEQCNTYSEKIQKLDQYIQSLESTILQKEKEHRSHSYDIEDLALFQRYETAIENRLFKAVQAFLSYKKSKWESLYGFSNKNGFVL